MRCISFVMASLLLTAAAAPVLAQQSSLPMVSNAVTLVRPVWQNSFAPEPITPTSVHFLKNAGIGVIQRNDYDFAQADHSHPQPVHFLMAHPHAPYLIMLSLMSSRVQRISAMGGSLYRKLGH